MTRVIVWDWKDQPDAGDLTEAATAGLWTFSYVPDTRGDFHALVASDGELSTEQVQAAFEEWVAAQVEL